jgi:hemerythrin superfamily protein
MNALEMLKNDHRKVDQLFEQMNNAEEFSEKTELFQKIKDELQLHASLEESSFYPLFSEKPGFEDLVEDSIDDHQEVKSLLEEISAIEDEDEFDERIDELMESVQYHVEQEENEFFPRVEAILSKEELDQMGSEMDEMRRSPSLAA